MNTTYNVSQIPYIHRKHQDHTPTPHATPSLRFSEERDIARSTSQHDPSAYTNSTAPQTHYHRHDGDIRYLDDKHEDLISCQSVAVVIGNLGDFGLNKRQLHELFSGYSTSGLERFMLEQEESIYARRNRLESEENIQFFITGLMCPGKSSAANTQAAGEAENTRGHAKTKSHEHLMTDIGIPQDSSRTGSDSSAKGRAV